MSGLVFTKNINIPTTLEYSGGSNLEAKKNNEPEDVLCFRPEGFKEMQKQHELLKQGLPVEQKLELVEGTKTSVGLVTWITWMMMLFMTKGMDTVFKILINNDTEELDLISNWGKATKESVKDWVTRLKGPLGDKFDKENLKLLAFVVRASLGPQLLARVISLTEAGSSGPELFLAAVHQVNHMTASLVRAISNEIGNLKLKSIPGENVAKLGEQIVDKVKQIECSGGVPADLLFLVSKPCTTGSQETFRTFAQQNYTSVIDGNCTAHYQDIVSKMSNFYLNLVMNKDYSPAMGGKQDSDTTTLHGMIAKLTEQVNQLRVNPSNNNSAGSGGSRFKRKCWTCGSEDHLNRDCPKKTSGTSNGSNNTHPGIEEWRKKAPGAGEAEEKVVDGVKHKWCSKCMKGTGVWTMGGTAHVTSDHKTQKERTEEQARQNQTGSLAMFPDEPLEVHFG